MTLSKIKKDIQNIAKQIKNLECNELEDVLNEINALSGQISELGEEKQCAWSRGPLGISVIKKPFDVY